jgi:hypothetical protein
MVVLHIALRIARTVPSLKPRPADAVFRRAATYVDESAQCWYISS